MFDTVWSDAISDADGSPGEHLALLDAELSEMLDVSGSIADDALEVTIAAICEAVRRINELEARTAVLFERARQQALRTDCLLNLDDANVQNADQARLEYLSCGAITAEIAVDAHLTEYNVGGRMHAAQRLAERAPRTLAGAFCGEVSWRNASLVADAVSDLDPVVADRLDAAVAERAGRLNPTAFKRTLRTTRERIHPIKPSTRHAEAATKRYASLDPANDGMAYLTIYSTAATLGAAYDRVEKLAKQARTVGDTRTQEQLRADVACALLLDDGTLDLTAVAAAVAAEAGDADTLEPTPGERWLTRHSLGVLTRAVRPRVYVTIPMLTLLGQDDTPASLNGHIPIDPETARELCGQATSFTRLLTDPIQGDVLATDARTYRPPADLAQYVTLRDGTCRFPGCGAKAARCDLDHTIPFDITGNNAGGPTAATNLAALCRKHHTLKHQTTFTVHQAPATNSTLTWETPLHHIAVTQPSAQAEKDWGPPPF
ncbi:MAG: HNH endonuclease [Promicromonosporaceae bacterium]|nr:HNH endonuclease [Promicromonosporaceae bacterium]